MSRRGLASYGMDLENVLHRYAVNSLRRNNPGVEIIAEANGVETRLSVPMQNIAQSDPAPFKKKEETAVVLPSPGLVATAMSIPTFCGGTIFYSDRTSYWYMIDSKEVARKVLVDLLVQKGFFTTLLMFPDRDDGVWATLFKWFEEGEHIEMLYAGYRYVYQVKITNHLRSWNSGNVVKMFMLEGVSMVITAEEVERRRDSRRQRRNQSEELIQHLYESEKVWALNPTLTKL